MGGNLNVKGLGGHKERVFGGGFANSNKRKVAIGGQFGELADGANFFDFGPTPGIKAITHGGKPRRMVKLRVMDFFNQSPLQENFGFGAAMMPYGYGRKQNQRAGNKAFGNRWVQKYMNQHQHKHEHKKPVQNKKHSLQLIADPFDHSDKA